MGKVVIHAGGFARVGGIETFIKDLTIGLRARAIDIELICWGEENLLLREMRNAGVPIRRRAWRWGCRYAWPDKVLMPIFRKVVAAADLVVFGKIEPNSIRELKILRQRNAGPAAIFITPYRPAEMWKGVDCVDSTLNCFDAIVVQSEVFRTDLIRMGYRGLIRVLPYVPPRCSEPTPLPDGPIRIGFVGRLVPDKNLEYLIEVSAIVRRRVSTTLHLFGSGNEERRLVRKAESLGLKEGVRFHGELTPDGVQRAIDSCHVFAFSSKTEGQALAALEILAHGRTVVATPVGVFPELLGDGLLGRLGPLDNAEEFANVLIELCQRVKKGLSPPESIQAEYERRFPRDEVLAQYADLMREFSVSRASAVCCVGMQDSRE
jgi:glycosyltransferase involved in cell wall biosynthesis